MKRILTKPIVFKATCPKCKCEFEYDMNEVRGFIEHYSTVSRTFSGVTCPNCDFVIPHITDTELKREDTMKT